MNILIGVLIILGLLLLVTLLCVLDIKRIKYAEKAGKSKEFDERQIKAQYRAGSFVLVLILLCLLGIAIFFLIYEDGSYPVNPIILVMGTITIALIGNSLYCLLSDAILPLYTKRFGTMIINLVCGAMLVVGAVLDGSIPLTGEGSFRWIHLIYGAGAIVNGMIYLIAHLREKRKDREQE